MIQQAAKLVLVVEDDEDTRSFTTMLLEYLGYRVVSAGNGQEALNYVHTIQEPPALILLDMRMPVMDGVAFLMERQRDQVLKAIPVVACSATANELQARLLNASAFLAKPFDPYQFVATVAQHAGTAAADPQALELLGQGPRGDRGV